MKAPRLSFKDVAVVCGLGVLCLVMLLLWAPPLEMGRNEARTAQAYNMVRTYHRLLTTPTANFELAENDPWGTPYRVTALPDGGLRVLSCGYDLTTPEDAPDQNDLYSDMPTNPARVNTQRRQREALTLLALTGGAWLLLSVWYLRWR
ncbi:hypothetical protein GC163_07605 [bacterium]|nr:hypothetical protein [bacterium]